MTDTDNKQETPAAAAPEAPATQIGVLGQPMQPLSFQPLGFGGAPALNAGFAGEIGQFSVAQQNGIGQGNLVDEVQNAGGFGLAMPAPKIGLGASELGGMQQPLFQTSEQFGLVNGATGAMNFGLPTEQQFNFFQPMPMMAAADLAAAPETSAALGEGEAVGGGESSDNNGPAEKAEDDESAAHAPTAVIGSPAAEEAEKAEFVDAVKPVVSSSTEATSAATSATGTPEDSVPVHPITIAAPATVATAQQGGSLEPSYVGAMPTFTMPPSLDNTAATPIMDPSAMALHGLNHEADGAGFTKADPRTSLGAKKAGGGGKKRPSGFCACFGI